MGEKLFNVGIKAVIKKGDKVLIVKNVEGYWEVPGGRIDGDESVVQTLHRELNEELPNIHSIVIERILDVKRLHKDIKADVSLVLVFYQVSAAFDGEPKLSREHTEYKWASKDEALKLAYDSCGSAITTAFSS